MTAYTAGEIASSLGSECVRLIGDESRPVKSVASLDNVHEGCLTYVNATKDVRDIENLKPLAQSSVVCSPSHGSAISEMGATAITTNNPRLAFMRAVAEFFSPPPLPAGVHPKAVIASTAQIDHIASIGPGVVVSENCRVGAGTVIHPNVTLYHDVFIGSGVVIHSGTVIGADGFGYERTGDGDFIKFPHLGRVIIEDNVEVGSNTSIDRGTLDDTIICEGAKIDNQCHISHNVVIGRNSAVIAQSMLGGSVRVGEYSWVAPAGIVMNQVKIGDRSTVGLGAVVIKNVAPEQTVMGSPATDAVEFRATRAALKELVSKKD
jgi:UDP-3-O-[3-hydroxymyristoyl] glucosamine N-acyltransferase